jgi:hypothetical protein
MSDGDSSSPPPCPPPSPATYLSQSDRPTSTPSSSSNRATIPGSCSRNSYPAEG